MYKEKLSIRFLLHHLLCATSPVPGHKTLLRNHNNFTPQKQHAKQLLTAPKTVLKRTFIAPKNSNFFLLIEPVFLSFSISSVKRKSW